MIGKKKKNLLILLPIIVLFNACSDRVNIPIKSNDSTLIYPSKTKNGIEAEIILSEKISTKSGRPIKPGTVFPIKAKSKLHTVIKLKNRNLHSDKTLMFHVDWLDSSGNSIFKKRIDLTADDKTDVLTSTISNTPDRRNIGKYFLRVYLFRELIAEKEFMLVNEVVDPIKLLRKEMAENIKVSISFGKKLRKKTGKLLNIDTSFTIKKKAKVYAVVDLKNLELYKNEKITFYLDWIGPDNNSFYRKKVVKSKGDTYSTISSSISIIPKNREPGKYFLKVYLFKELLATASFYLLGN